MCAYPTELTSSSVRSIHLPSGNSVDVPVVSTRLHRWGGEPPGDTYGGKAILSYAGEPVFAELAVLRAFERSGWQGVWIDSYRQKYRRAYWHDKGVTVLPTNAASLLARIRAKADVTARPWDVYCWDANDAFAFIELKRRKRDRLRLSQLSWLEAALRAGLTSESFLIVEWDLHGSGAAV